MEYISNFAQTFFAFVLLLGVLVFIHEFGHFIVAKAFNMRVETFSIGMGKKFLRFQRGETEYALSLIPLGGYVKITGQDPREEVPPEIAARSFRDKPIYQRTAVVLAGPLFNAALAILVFVFLFNVGLPSKAAILERVLPDSPAAQAGFTNGDKVISVTSSDGQMQKIYDVSDLEKIVGKSAGASLRFQVQRSVTPLPQLTAGEVPVDLRKTQNVDVTYTPEMGDERDSTIGVVVKRGIIKGAEKSAPSSMVFARKDSWAEMKGLPGFFLVSEVSYNSQGKTKTFAINSIYDLENAWAYMANDVSMDRGEISLKGQQVKLPAPGEKATASQAETPPQEPKEEILSFKWEGKSAFPQTLAEAGFVSAEMVIAEVKADSPAQKLGLKTGDWIQKLNGEEAVSFTSFRDRLQEIAASHEPVEIEWMREGEAQKAKVLPQVVSSKDPYTEVAKSQFQIGAAFLAMPANPTIEVVKAANFGESVTLGFDRTVGLTKSMLNSFVMLASGQISPKTLGGPLLIAKISGESLKQGYVSFLRMMAFISLNLFILNLLPIPVLDGGHLVLFFFEAVRRKPLSIKVIEIWTTAGFFLLMGLVAVVFFNDLSRLGLFRIFRS